MKPYRVFSFFLLLSFFWSQIAYSNQHRTALVIGNADYETLSNLKTPVRDATAVSETLSSLGFTVYLATDLDSKELHSAFQYYSEKSALADVSLIYFAGHGALANGQNYLFPTDLDVGLTNNWFGAVNLADVQTLMNRNEAINILLVDSCREIAPNLLASHADQLTPLAVSPSSVGTIIAYASSPGQVAFDGTGKHSLFTGALLDNITRPEVDIETMLRAVRRDVLNNSQGSQLPQTQSSLVSEFSFVPSVGKSSHVENSRSQSLQDTGFSRKPILQLISEGLSGTQTLQPASDIRSKLCQSLPYPKPSECREFSINQVLAPN